MIAPWPDFKGRAIHEGDRLRHPDGTEGIVIYRPEDDSKASGYGWKVDYGDTDQEGYPVLWWLGLQIGDRGMAEVVRLTKERREAEIAMRLRSMEWAILWWKTTSWGENDPCLDGASLFSDVCREISAWVGWQAAHPEVNQ